MCVLPISRVCVFLIFPCDCHLSVKGNLLTYFLTIIIFRPERSRHTATSCSFWRWSTKCRLQ